MSDIIEETHCTFSKQQQMFYKKKNRVWYRLAFGALLFCLVLYMTARFFLNIIAKESREKTKRPEWGDNDDAGPFCV